MVKSSKHFIKSAMRYGSAVTIDIQYCSVELSEGNKKGKYNEGKEKGKTMFICS